MRCRDSVQVYAGGDIPIVPVLPSLLYSVRAGGELIIHDLPDFLTENVVHDNSYMTGRWKRKRRIVVPES